MSTPIETAAEAVADLNERSQIAGMRLSSKAYARAALASLAQHREDIARVLDEHRPGFDQTAVFMDCECGWDGDQDDHPGHQADAVLAFLTGEAS